MVNYKRQIVDSIDYKGYIHSFKAFDLSHKFIHLQATTLSSPDDMSTHNVTDGIAIKYQVPTGKEFWIINARWISHMTQTGDKAYYSDDESAETNGVDILNWPSNLLDGDLFIFGPVPAGKYINYHDATTNKQLRFTGWEINAQ